MSLGYLLNFIRTENIIELKLDANKIDWVHHFLKVSLSTTFVTHCLEFVSTLMSSVVLPTSSKFTCTFTKATKCVVQSDLWKSFFFFLQKWDHMINIVLSYFQNIYLQWLSSFQILVCSRYWLPAKSSIGAIQGHAFEKQTVLGFLLGLTSMSRDSSKPSVSSR